MRTILLLAILLLSGCGAVNEHGINAWALVGTTEPSIAEGRVGYRISSDIEAGITGTWVMQQNETSIFGAYGIYKYPETIAVPNPLYGIVGPEKIEAQAYGGLEISLDIDQDRSWATWVGGGLINNLIVVEYQRADFSDQAGEALPDDNRLILGLRFEIP